MFSFTKFTIFVFIYSSSPNGCEHFILQGCPGSRVDEASKLGFLTLKLESSHYLLSWAIGRPITQVMIPQMQSERKAAPKQATATPGRVRSETDRTASGAQLPHCDQPALRFTDWM